MKGKKHKSMETPRSRAPVILYAVAALFAVAGLADATYLTVIALTGETAACGGSTGCYEVLGSGYARVAGIPVAALGLLGYFSAFTFAVFAAFDYARAQKLFVLTVSALFAATLWFLYVQAFLLHAYCRYCLFSAAISFLLMGLVVATPSRSKEKP
ncbi:MAG: hypothetical protein V7609_1140 [Verrucomicrobiota bacterium]